MTELSDLELLNLLMYGHKTASDAIAYNKHYNEVHNYVIEKLQEKYPDRILKRFHFTPGDDFLTVTKEQMWEDFDRMTNARDHKEDETGD